MKIKIFLVLLLLLPTTIKAYNTSASATILYEINTGKVIYAENENLIRSVASISKIMTAIIAIEHGNLEELIVVDDVIKDAYGSSIYLEINEEITLEQLLYGLMLRSGNDAALVIAQYISLSPENFVQLMNEKAKEIGMKNTQFNNPHGLEQNGGNTSTAYDMAILTSYAMQNEIYKEITSTEEYSFKTNVKNHHFDNKHKLLYQEEYITGGKTGYTEIANRTLVTTAEQNNISLVAVTLNDGNDFVDHINLFEEAFNSLCNIEILNKGTINIPNETIYKNSILYIENDINYITDKQDENIILEYKLKTTEDFNSGDIIGMLNVIVDNKIVHVENIFIEKKKQSLIEKFFAWLF